MLESAILPIIFFLLVMLVVYLWASQRNLIKNRALTPPRIFVISKCYMKFFQIPDTGKKVPVWKSATFDAELHDITTFGRVWIISIKSLKADNRNPTHGIHIIFSKEDYRLQSNLLSSF